MTSEEFLRELLDQVADFYHKLDGSPPAYSYIPLRTDEERVRVMKSGLFNELRAADLFGPWLKTTPEFEVKAALAESAHEEMVHAQLLCKRIQWIKQPYRRITEDEEGHGSMRQAILKRYATTVEKQDGARSRRGYAPGPVSRVPRQLGALGDGQRPVVRGDSKRVPNPQDPLVICRACFRPFSWPGILPGSRQSSGAVCHDRARRAARQLGLPANAAQ